jgi:nucleoside phosphorylase
MHIVVFLTIFCLASLPAVASAVALFFALEEDISALKKEGATQVRSFSVGDTTILQLALHGHSIYATKMGSGCVQTSLSAQALLAKQKCDLAISIGPVGDIKGNLDTKSWYRISKVVSWQRGTQNDTGFVAHREATQSLTLPQADPKLPNAYASLPVISVASGEVFVASDSFRCDLASLSKCEAVDMNLFGLLAVLNSHKIDGTHLRVPSDRADNKAGEDFRKFTEEYQGEGGRIVAQIIRTLPEDPTSPNAHPALRDILNGPQTKESRPQVPRSEKEKDD